MADAVTAYNLKNCNIM